MKRHGKRRKKNNNWKRINLMRSKLMIGALLVALCALYLFSHKTTPNTSEHTKLLIQGLTNSPALKTITESLSEKINAIIKEELSLNTDYNADFFSPKPIQRLTLYYINDACTDGNDIIFSSLDTINISNFTINTVALKSDVEFFGGPFNEKDELVIMINDPNKELSHYNEIIKQALHKANEQYKQTHDHDLYDIAKSEQYSYLPHIGLGRVRSNSVKSNIKNQSQYAIIFERIQSRIKKVALECIEHVLNENSKELIFDKIGILDLNKHAYIKEYAINK